MVQCKKTIVGYFVTAMYFDVPLCNYTLTVQKYIKMNRKVPSCSYNIVRYSTSESSA